VDHSRASMRGEVRCWVTYNANNFPALGGTGYGTTLATGGWGVFSTLRGTRGLRMSSMSSTLPLLALIYPTS
jgi:hypothetical protein